MDLFSKQRWLQETGAVFCAKCFVDLMRLEETTLRRGDAELTATVGTMIKASLACLKALAVDLHCGVKHWEVVFATMDLCEVTACGDLWVDLVGCHEKWMGLVGFHTLLPTLKELEMALKSKVLDGAYEESLMRRDPPTDVFSAWRGVCNEMTLFQTMFEDEVTNYHRLLDAISQSPYPKQFRLFNSQRGAVMTTAALETMNQNVNQRIKHDLHHHCPTVQAMLQQAEKEAERLLVAKPTIEWNDKAKRPSVCWHPKEKPQSNEASQSVADGGCAVDEAVVKAIGDELRMLRKTLKGKGISGKKLNKHAEVKALSGKLAEARRGALAPAKDAAPR